MSEKYLNKKEKIADICELPKDIILGAPILSVTGNREIEIDNFKKLLEYSQEKIVIQCKDWKISVEGSKLEIILYTRDELKIWGIITGILFG
ncbi:MAG: YabP/YqfC family sporulation protein [Lachnospiraceae bacterium]|nr:YabP/YqfC family sporulation protein [Lachnospiraceae bacterium]